MSTLLLLHSTLLLFQFTLLLLSYIFSEKRTVPKIDRSVSLLNMLFLHFQQEVVCQQGEVLEKWEQSNHKYIVQYSILYETVFSWKCKTSLYGVACCCLFSSLLLLPSLIGVWGHHGYDVLSGNLIEGVVVSLQLYKHVNYSHFVF